MNKLLLALAALSLTACSTNLTPAIVRIDGRAVELVEAGSGPATVVFEAGFGNDWTPWDDVASAVASHAKVFAYSRPGYGGSDPAATPRDAAHIVEELRALLALRGHAPPYVLVGHSFGGTYMELFAKSHPDEVAAVVLVDPRHRDFTSACEQAQFTLCAIPASVVASLPAVQVAEFTAFATAPAQIDAAGPFGPAPVRVLAATDHDGFTSGQEALWGRLLANLAGEAPDGKLVTFQGVGHYIQVYRPSEVAQIIQGLLPASR